MTVELHEDSNLDARIRYSKALAKSNLLPREHRDKPENVLIAIEYGYALGIPPIQALNQVFIVEGKPSASADLIAALVRRAGHKLRVTEEPTTDGLRVTASLIRSDDPEFVFSATWDMAKARAAGLGGKDVWRKYPGQMLRARAITEVCRQGASDALYGVIYTPEELGRDGEPAAGVTVEVEAPRVSQATSIDAALSAMEAFDEPVDAEIVVDVDPLTEPARTPEPTAADVAACTDVDELRAMWKASPRDSEQRALIEARIAKLNEPADGALIPSGGAS